MIKHLFEQHSEAWHQSRLGRVTGTRFKDLMAAKTTAAYQNLIADIAAEILTETGDDQDNFVSEAMQHGIDTEPEARKFYSELYGVEVEQVGFVTPDDDHKYSEWVGVSPDGLLPGNGLLEIKCPKRSTHLYYIQSGKLPAAYKWQVYGQLYVTGADYCDFMSYVPGMKPFIIQVKPDAEIFRQIEAELDELIAAVRSLQMEYENYEY